MRRVPHASLASQFAAGSSYFRPVAPMLSNAEQAERHRKLRAAQELKESAFLLGNRWEEHTAEDLVEAARLWTEVSEAYEALGNRAQEAHESRHEARRCRETAAEQTRKKGAGA